MRRRRGPARPARGGRHPFNLGVAAGESTGLLYALRQGYARALRVPVRMRSRRAGLSSLTPWRSVFYMAKVSFALLLERFRTV
ncbi:hypothetical protein [Stigmatella erecta]|nr:hypothetical protein [Stigmatella erecta]